MLGWTNERKIDTLIDRAKALTARIKVANDQLTGHIKTRDAAIHRGKVLAALDQTR